MKKMAILDKTKNDDGKYERDKMHKNHRNHGGELYADREETQEIPV